MTVTALSVWFSRSALARTADALTVQAAERGFPSLAVDPDAAHSAAKLRALQLSTADNDFTPAKEA
jgi:hypothetical protein